MSHRVLRVSGTIRWGSRMQVEVIVQQIAYQTRLLTEGYVGTLDHEMKFDETRAPTVNGF